MSNYVPPPKPPYAIGPLRGVENYPDLDLSKMSEEHAAAHAVMCRACTAPPLRRCTVGQYKYVPIHNPHQGRIEDGLRQVALSNEIIAEVIAEEDSP